VRLCAVSVDLDEIPNYFAIHGLPESTGPESHAVYDVALDRLESFAESARLPLTLFAIGSDLARKEAATRLARAHANGHEIANHSLDHRYDLVRMGREEIRAQIEEGARAIERAVGERPVGFRAPGYTITDEVFEVLAEIGVAYDSSVFPC
jgi:peptidoglycan/xylan/chitin deacetylase (PgdA/CDA1 family)